ncbi:MAG TPA: hypothetical protein VJU18_15455 [Vicinamibacteria bacterium]|nr:hypothetical protein [Vicinamibacteria bacterium]
MMRRTAELAVVVVVGLLAACGHPEQTVVTQYFNAVKAKDNQTLTSFSSVAFDKAVQSWKILATSEETKGPAPLPGLIKAVKDAENQVSLNRQEATKYRNDHFAAWEQVQEVQKKNLPMPPAVSAVAETYQQYTKKDQELKKGVAQAKEAVDRERHLVGLSLGQLPDLDTLEGEVLQKQLDLELTIGGQPQVWVMTLRRYNMTRPGAGPRVLSRWIIQDLQPKS